MKQMREKQRSVTKAKIVLRKDVHKWDQDAKDRMDTDSDSDSEDQYDLLPKAQEDDFPVTTKFGNANVECLPINDDKEEWKNEE